jgi:hypothetical protein
MGEQGWNVAAYTCACHPGVMWGIGGDIGPTLSSSPEAADASTFWYGVGAWTAGPAADARTFVGLDDLRAAHPDLTPVAVDNVAALLADHEQLSGRIAALDARPLFSTRRVMQALLCAVGDPVDEHALIKRIDGGLTLADVAELAVAAINEPCHDLEAFERQAAELAKLRIQVQAGACPHTEAIGELHLKWLAEVADLKQRILDIDAHATPYGDIPDEPGWVGTYLVTAGALHRALGKVGHSAPKCQAEADRDRLEAERDEARAKRDQVVENAVAWMDEARHQAVERDRLADTIRRVRELVDSYPPGSNFAQSGLQQLFRRTLDGADREQKTAHRPASEDIHTEETP